MALAYRVSIAQPTLFVKRVNKKFSADYLNKTPFCNILQNKNSICLMLLFNNIEIILTDIDRAESFNYDQLDKMDMKYVWDMTSKTHKRIINIFYDDYDGFRLLLCHVDGTPNTLEKGQKSKSSVKENAMSKSDSKRYG